MTALDYKSDEKQAADDRLDPYSDSARDLYKQENDSIPDYDRASDGLDDHPVTAGDASGKSGDIGDKPTKNIDAAGEKERSGGGWKDNTSGAGGIKPSSFKKLGAREILKEQGPIGMIVIILLMIGGGLSFLSPGFLIIDIKEKYIDKFNDMRATMEVEDVAVLKKKFIGQTSITGCKKLSIRCKINTLSDRQLKRIEKDGNIKVHTTGELTFLKGRHKVESFEYKGKKITADMFEAELRADPNFRASMRKGHNPKLAGYANGPFTKLANRISFNKQQNLKGTTPDELKEDMDKAVSGKGFAEASARVTSTEEACQGTDNGCTDGKRTVYRDENGAIIDKATYDQRLGGVSAFQAEVEARKSLTDTGSAVAKGTLKGVLTSTAFGLGAVDSACTGYTLIRTVGFAAKYLGMLMRLRFFQVFANTADFAKVGFINDPDEQVKPEQMAFLGDLATSVNAEGKSFTDSYGYHYAVYGDINPMPRGENTGGTRGADGITLTDEQKKQVMLDNEVTDHINGQLVSDNLLTTIIGMTGNSGSTDEIDAACGFVKSGWGQTIIIGTAVIGAVAAFFSGGASLGWGAAAQVAISVAIGVAIAMLTPKLIDMAAGTMDIENGNEAGNAATSGAGAMNTQTFMAQGLPALQKEDAVGYREITNETLAMYAEEDRQKYSPLDITNRHTFMGSLASRIVPYTAKMTNVGSGISSLANLTASSLASIFPRTNAATTMAEYEVCQDRDYVEQNMAVDPFCNPRGGTKEDERNMDPESAIDYMEANNYIAKDSETGAPLTSDNEYAKYIKSCMEREVPIGGFTEADPTDRGTQCILGRSAPAEEEKYKNFRKLFRAVSAENTRTDGYGLPPGAAGGTAGDGTAPITGDARALALQVIANENIQFVNPATEEQLKIFGEGGTVYDANLRPMTVSKHLLGALLTNARKYKILINNIGFYEDRSLKENLPYQHPAGTAVDLNNIEIIGGASTGGSIELPADAGIANQYATDFLAALPLNRGGVGQSDHGMNPTFPPGSVALNGSHLFPDAGNHLHIDARNRENLMDTE